MTYRITFALGLFNGPADRAESHKALNILLAALTKIDIEYLRDHPETPDIYKSGVRYVEELSGLEDWQDIPTCLVTRRGDCEDLACWRAAELNVRHGIKAYPIYGFRTLPNGNVVYHIRIQYPAVGGTGPGRIEDPSRMLGMR